MAAKCHWRIPPDTRHDVVNRDGRARVWTLLAADEVRPEAVVVGGAEPEARVHLLLVVGLAATVDQVRPPDVFATLLVAAPIRFLTIAAAIMGAFAPLALFGPPPPLADGRSMFDESPLG